MTQIAKIAGIYEDPPVLAHVEKRLLYASDGYCANPVIGLDEYEQLACQDWLKLFIPPGMAILLFSFLLLNPEGYLVFFSNDSNFPLDVFVRGINIPSTTTVRVGHNPQM